MICPNCQKEAPWVENKEKYGRNYGKSFMCYFCKPCGTYVGCHNNTKKPLGTMADKETMEWRQKVHAKIDPLWKSGEIPRGKIYRIITKALGLKKQYHTGYADIETCKKIMGLDLSTNLK